MIIFSSSALAEDLTTCNPISKYSLTDEYVGSMTLKCPRADSWGRLPAEVNYIRNAQEVTLLSSNSARCDFELQLENEKGF